MARKAVTTGGTRDEILRIAKRLFLEKGFDGVTIRTIQREVGCEVGLFYYYFKSKEQIFDVVMDEFESEWKKAFDKILGEEETSRAQRLMVVFETVMDILKKFSAQAEDMLHWSVRGAVSHRLGDLVEGYVAEVLGDDKNALGASNTALATVLAGGLVKLAEDALVHKTGRTEYVLRELLEGVFGGNSEEAYSSGRREDISVVLL